MKDKAIVRYIGQRTLVGGGREFDFSVTPAGEEASRISIEASAELFSGPDRIAIQEGAGICYETLRLRIEEDRIIPSSRFRLGSSDVAQHRKFARVPGGRAPR